MIIRVSLAKNRLKVTILTLQQPIAMGEVMIKAKLERFHIVMLNHDVQIKPRSE